MGQLDPQTPISTLFIMLRSDNVPQCNRPRPVLRSTDVSKNVAETNMGSQIMSSMCSANIHAILTARRDTCCETYSWLDTMRLSDISVTFAYAIEYITAMMRRTMQLSATANP